MRIPSAKTLTIVFQENAKQARKILETENTSTINSPSVCDARKTAFRPHKKYYIKMLALSDLDNGLYGIESMETANGEYADYINAGDTYASPVSQ